MLFGPVLPFVGTFIEAIDEAIQQHDPRARLSRAQRAWLGFCIMGILVTNVVSWAHFERASLRAYTVSGLSCDVSPLEDPLAVALADEHARDPAPFWHHRRRARP